jgi:hypothetical protein
MQNIYDIGSSCSKNLFIFNTQFSMKNEEIGIIDQHMNATCQM